MLLAAVTATGFPAVLVVLGVVVGVVGMWMFATGRPSEIGSKFLGAGIGIMALGIIFASF